MGNVVRYSRSKRGLPMNRTISLAFVLLAVMTFAGWLLVGAAGWARADGAYNPSNIEHSYGPYYTGPCNDGIDNDYDGYTDAADSDCIGPKPLATPTSTAPATPASTSTPAPSATPTAYPPSLGGVAVYPHLPSGNDAHAVIALVLAFAGLLSGGAGWYAWRRTGH